MAFSVMLTCKRFTAHGTHKRPLIRMCSQMRTEIICACKPLRTEITLECGGMFLDSFGVTILKATRCSLVLWISKAKDVVTIWKRRRGLATSLR